MGDPKGQGTQRDGRPKGTGDPKAQGTQRDGGHKGMKDPKPWGTQRDGGPQSHIHPHRFPLPPSPGAAVSPPERQRRRDGLTEQQAVIGGHLWGGDSEGGTCGVGVATGTGR